MNLLKHFNTPAFLTVFLVSGMLGISICDRNYRPAFSELAKTALTAYVGAMTLGRQSKSSDPD